MSWFKKPVNIAITIGAALLAAVAIGLIIWGVTHHTEGGLLEVCWAPDGEARYVEGSERNYGTCEGAEELVWPQEQIPLTIASLSPEGQRLDASSPQVRALQNATTDLNRQLGFELFRVGGGLDATDADVRFGGALERAGASPPPGYVSHVRAGNMLRGHVNIRSDVESDARLLHLVLEHELLHLAGLAHDDFTASIMFPITHDEWGTDRMSTAHVTDWDVNLLRGLYHRP